MNRRTILGSIAALFAAPVAARAKPRKVYRDLTGPYSVPDLKLQRAWLNGRWRPVTELEPAEERDPIPASWGPLPHEHDAYIEIRIGEWRQAIRMCGSKDPIQTVKNMLRPDSILTDTIDQHLSWPESKLHAIRAESKAAVHAYMARLRREGLI